MSTDLAGPFGLQSWANALVLEDVGLPATDVFLHAEHNQQMAPITLARLLDGGGMALPVTGMAAAEPTAPAIGDRFAVSGTWGAFVPGQIIERRAGAVWYVTAARVGTVVPRLDVVGRYSRWTGGGWVDYALISSADQAKIDALTDPHRLTDDEITTGAATTAGLITAAQARLAARTHGAQGAIPQTLDNLPDGTTRFALVTADRDLLTLVEEATAAASANKLMKRNANGRVKGVAGLEPDDYVTVSQLGGGGGGGTALIDRLRWRGTASAATPLLAATETVVAIDTEGYDRLTNLTVASGAVDLAAGVYRVRAQGVFECVSGDLLQPVYQLAVAHNGSGSYVAQPGTTVPQFPAPDADAGDQALMLVTEAVFTLLAPASVRLHATSSLAGNVRSGAWVTIEEVGVSIATGGGGGTSYGAAGAVQASDGAQGFTHLPVARQARLQRACADVSEPVWSGRVASLIAPVNAHRSFLTLTTNPAPVEQANGDVVVTVTAPTTFADALDNYCEDFVLCVRNAHAANEVRIVLSGFIAAGAIAKQLRLPPGAAGELRYWYRSNGSAAEWWCEGAPLIDDRLEYSGPVTANAVIVFPARRAMTVPAWTSDQFFLWAPDGAPSAETVFTWQERVAGVWTTRGTSTFAANIAFADTVFVAKIRGSGNAWRLVAPAALNGLTSIVGGINIGVVFAG